MAKSSAKASVADISLVGSFVHLAQQQKHENKNKTLWYGSQAARLSMEW